MKFVFILSIISMVMVVVIAKRHKWSQRDKEDSAEENISSIDMRGTLSKSFFLSGANAGKNTICSPLSALMPLGKLALGAENVALKELLLAIGLSKKSKIKKRFQSLLADLQSLPGGKLVIASRMYIPDNAHLRKNFEDQSKAIFNSSASKISLQYPTYAADEINGWVSKQTNNIIQDIISPSDLKPLTSLVLINAVYFYGRWKEAFRDMENKVFHTPRGRQKVLMMTRAGEYNYTKSDALSAEIIQIPYVGEKASMVVVLPVKREGLEVLLNQLKLAPELLDSAMSNMGVTLVDLSLPKFKINSKLNLKSSYEQAGVKQIFKDNDSDLTKIRRDGSVYVSTAMHNAFIEVHQFGSEAGASSSLVLTQLSYQKPVTFNADHPFLFFILVEKQQLFAGTLLYPHLAEMTSF